jgi:hypothetical protein
VIPLLLSTSEASTHRSLPSFGRNLRLASTSAASAAAGRIADRPAPISHAATKTTRVRVILRSVPAPTFGGKRGAHAYKRAY